MFIDGEVEEVVISDSIVTIESDAFISTGGMSIEYGLPYLKKIHIGKNVKNIEAPGFRINAWYPLVASDDEIQNGTKMTVDPENKWFTMYEKGLYTKDLTELLWYPPQATEIHLPQTLKQIGTRALFYCSISEIDIPYGTLKLDEFAFIECTKLKKSICLTAY